MTHSSIPPQRRACEWERVKQKAKGLWLWCPAAAACVYKLCTSISRCSTWLNSTHMQCSVCPSRRIWPSSRWFKSGLIPPPPPAPPPHSLSDPAAAAAAELCNTNLKEKVSNFKLLTVQSKLSIDVAAGAAIDVDDDDDEKMINSRGRGVESRGRIITIDVRTTTKEDLGVSETKKVTNEQTTDRPTNRPFTWWTAATATASLRSAWFESGK